MIIRKHCIPVSIQFFKVIPLKQSDPISKCFLPVPNKHYVVVLKDLEMLGTGCTVTKSLFCNLKWLLLSSRLQASCCPRCWSLRSKMRLPQCCESGLTQGERREEKNLQYSAQLLWHVQGHLFYSDIWEHSYSQRAVAKRHERVVLLKQSSHSKCIFIGFEHGFCIDIEKQLLFLRRYLYLNVMFANKRRRKLHIWIEVSFLLAKLESSG